MPDFDPFESLGPRLTDDEREEVTRRLRSLTGDPVRYDFGDPDVFAYTDRQRGRLTDDSGVPIAKDFEPFEPSVQRRDAWIETPVGENEPNHPLAVYKTKKLLKRNGFHEFRPGIEPMGEASPRFLASLKRFQAANDLKPDAMAWPGGPTVHMLLHKAFGEGDGPPPAVESGLFKDRFGKDPNRTLSGRLIFGGAGAEFTKAGSADQSADSNTDTLGERSFAPVEFPMEPPSVAPDERQPLAPRHDERPRTGTRRPAEPNTAFS